MIPVGHPGLVLLEDLHLISSAGSRDQHFGAFLYSNACVVAGLRAAARLAEKLGHDEPKTRWNSFADRIWNQGILPTIATRRDKGPGLHGPGDWPVPVGEESVKAAGPLDREP